jgi:hypothetical protein
MVERNMCNAVMRGTVIPSGSKSTSRANGLRRNLRYPTSGRRLIRFAELLARKAEKMKGEHVQAYTQQRGGCSNP